MAPLTDGSQNVKSSDCSNCSEMLRIVQSCSAGGELVGWNVPEVEWLKSLKEKPDAFRAERLEKHMLNGEG